MELLDACFEMVSTLSEIEKSTHYYIAGYVASKEKLCVREDEDEILKMHPCSEFTSLLSRGTLTYPLVELYDLSCVLFCSYKSVNTSCSPAYGNYVSTI